MMQLKHANVNSGAFVTLLGSFQGYNIKRLSKQDPTESNVQTSATDEWDIVESDGGGVENPHLTLTVTIDAQNPVSGELTETLLRAFVRQATGDYYLLIKYANTDIQLRDYYGLQNANGIKCELVSANQKFRNSSVVSKQHMYDVIMTFREVR